MLHLTLAGLSEDNKRLLLVSDSGEEFSLTIDRHLRAALRGEHARLGQLEIQMESTLRPRDIQTRIRAGESPESVAQAAQTTVEKILPFAGPVLAERAHVAERAQRASVRRKAGDQGARTLGEAVTAQLSPLNLTSDVVDWDSWRREDGRWTLTADYVAGKRKGSAKFTFDAPGNYVSIENDDARWLVGEVSSTPVKAERRDDLKQARQRRLTAVPEDELPLGDDAIEIANQGAAAPGDSDQQAPVLAEASTAPEVSDAPDDEPTADLSDTAEAVRSADPAPDSANVEAQDDDEPALAPTPEPLSESPEPTAPRNTTSDEADEAPETKPVRKPARKKGRASVPSWDEIMFGGGKQD